MKTLSDFKKALRTEGVKLETLSLANKISQGRLRIGMIRFINIHNTVGVYLKENNEDNSRGSFLGWGKATDWVFHGDIATHKFGMSYRVIMPTTEGATND